MFSLETDFGVNIQGASLTGHLKEHLSVLQTSSPLLVLKAWKSQEAASPVFTPKTVEKLFVKWTSAIHKKQGVHKSLQHHQEIQKWENMGLSVGRTYTIVAAYDGTTFEFLFMWLKHSSIRWKPDAKTLLKWVSCFDGRCAK